MSPLVLKKRLNDRPTHSPRTPHISFSSLARVDGSARFTFGPPSAGGPSALSSASGPIEVRLAAEHASQATLEVLVRPLSNVPATQAKALAAAVRGVLAPAVLLAQHPRTLIQVVAQVLSSGGSGGGGVAAAVVNASTLALISAGAVPLRGVVCAVAVGRRKGDRGLVVDPDEGDGVMDAEGCFAFVFTRDEEEEVRGRCVWANWGAVGKGVEGAFDFDEGVVGEARELACRGAREVYKAIHGSVEGLYMGKRDPVEDDDKMEI